jgi:hypothetical protein
MSCDITKEELQIVSDSFLLFKEYLPDHRDSEIFLKNTQIKQHFEHGSIDPIPVKHPDILGFMRNSTPFVFQTEEQIRVAVVYGLRLCGMNCEQIRNKIQNPFKTGGKVANTSEPLPIIKFPTLPSNLMTALETNLKFFCSS